MGKLDKLILENFKSYAGTQVIGPFDDFSCIIGPNGAGKSNLMDAISFVLGIQSRFLRSTTLKDLLFRKSSDAQPARKASVKLYYRVSANEIPNIAEGETVIFGRNISSSGVSTYQFQGKDVTFDEYEAILRSIGVLIKIRNFLVFQGDVESIASKSPGDLTKLIEHICGSDQLIEEYESLKRQRDEAEGTAIFNIAKKKMFVTQLKEVKAQKDEAETFQQHQLELKQTQSDYFTFLIWKCYMAGNKHEELLVDLRKRLKDYEKQEENQDKEILQVKKKVAQIQSLISQDNKDIEDGQKECDAFKHKLNSLKNKMKSSNKRLSDSEKNLSDVNKDITDQQNRIKKLQRDIDSKTKELDRYKHEMENLPSMELKLTKDDLQQYGALKELAAAQTSALRAKLLTVDMDIKDLERKSASLQSQREVARKEVAESDKFIKDYGERERTLKLQIANDQKTFNNLTTQKNESIAEFKSLNNTVNEYKEELDSTSEKLRAAGEEKRRGKQEQRMVDAIATMQVVLKGVHGRLIDLCRPIQKKYSQAVTVAAGRLIDAVVVDTKATATDCINYLKQHRVGKCTFLPLESMQMSSTLLERTRGLGSNYRACIDLVECSDLIKPALAFAFDNAVVCESLEAAQHLVFERNENFKAVTLHGQVVNPSGAMTGGSLRSGHDRWEENELEQLRERKTELESLLAQTADPGKVRNSIIQFEDKIREVQTKLQYKEADLKSVMERIKSFVDQNKLRKQRLEELETALSNVESDLAKLFTQQDQINVELTTIEDRAFDPLSSKLGIPNFRTHEATIATKSKDALEKYNTRSKELAALKAQLVYEQQKDFAAAQKRLQADIDKAKEDVKRCQKEDEEIQRQLKTALDGLDDKSQQKINRVEEKDKIVAKLRLFTNKKNEIHQGKDETSKKVAAEEIAIEKNKVELNDIIQRAQVEEVELVFAKDSSKGPPSRILLKISDKAQVDLTSVNNKYKGLADNEILEVEQQYQKKLQSLTDEIQEIQPNMHAAEKFDGMLEKVRECSEGVEKIKDTVKDIVTRFEDIRKRRLTMFNECFMHVSAALGEIYKNLTKSSKHPQGGNAYLTVDNTEEPYLGGIRFTAMPPMKRFRDMEQLSGGEKTVAALALLFSIHSFKPAPFFVLDEVDAALDNVNVKKICNYMQQRSTDFQCIVISLKDIFFENADSLVGITRDVDSASSKVFTLDLRQFGAAEEVEEELETDEPTENES